MSIKCGVYAKCSDNTVLFGSRTELNSSAKVELNKTWLSLWAKVASSMFDHEYELVLKIVSDKR